jgi:ABC-type glycerol-3-phosphate transport system substrate-binding protein
MAEAFTQANPNVTIEFVDVTYQRMREQALIKAQAGSPPDVTEPVVSWIPQLADAGILEPLKNHMSDAEIAKYVKSPVQDATYKGTEYGLPFWHGPIVLFANKELAKKAGYSAAAASDINDFKNRVQKIGSLGNDPKGQKILGFSLRNVKTANSAFWFTPWVWAWGGELVDSNNKANLDSKGVKDALAFYTFMTGNGYAAKGMDPYKTRIVFAEGRAGYVFDGPWLRGMLRNLSGNPDIDKLYDVTLMPKGVKGDNWTIANPTNLVVFKDSKNKEWAFEFAKFASANTDVLKGLYTNMGLLPTVKDMIENDPLMQDEFAKLFFKQMAFSRGIPWKDARWPGLQDILAKAMTDAVAGANIDSVAKTAQKEFEDLLED